MGTRVAVNISSRALHTLRCVLLGFASAPSSFSIPKQVEVQLSAEDQDCRSGMETNKTFRLPVSPAHKLHQRSRSDHGTAAADSHGATDCSKKANSDLFHGKRRPFHVKMTRSHLIDRFDRSLFMLTISKQQQPSTTSPSTKIKSPATMKFTSATLALLLTASASAFTPQKTPKFNSPVSTKSSVSPEQQSTTSTDKSLFDPLGLYSKDAPERTDGLLQPLESSTRDNPEKTTKDPLNLYSNKDEVDDKPMSASLPFLQRPFHARRHQHSRRPRL